MFDQALGARQRGLRYFTPLFNMPMWRTGFSGQIEAWSQQLDACDQAGWQLHTWAVGVDKDGRPQAMPVFVPKT